MKLLGKKRIIKVLSCITLIGIFLLLMQTQSRAQSVGETIVGGAGIIIDGIVGVFFYFFKIPLMILGWLFMRIIGFAINGLDGAWSGIPLDKVRSFQDTFLSTLRVNHKEDVIDVLASGQINDAVTAIIEKVAAETAVQYKQ